MLKVPFFQLKRLILVFNFIFPSFQVCTTVRLVLHDLIWYLLFALSLIMLMQCTWDAFILGHMKSFKMRRSENATCICYRTIIFRNCIYWQTWQAKLRWHYNKQVWTFVISEWRLPIQFTLEGSCEDHCHGYLNTKEMLPLKVIGALEKLTFVASTDMTWLT